MTYRKKDAQSETGGRQARHEWIRERPTGRAEVREDQGQNWELRIEEN